MDEPTLDEMQEKYPDYEIDYIISYVAIPKGTRIIKAMFLSSLDEKLTKEEE